MRYLWHTLQHISLRSQFKQTVGGTYVISRCGGKNRQGVAGGRRCRGGDASAFASAKSARIRSARCPEKHSAYLLRRVLMSIKSCCRCKCPNAAAGCLLHDAACCCKNGNIIMRQTLNCRSYLCPEFGRATRAATSTATETVFVFVFEFEFSLAISICNWQKAERSGVGARRAALSTRCGACHSLWQVGVVASLSVDCHYYHYQQ